jgi:hypothetical protein
MPVQNGCCHTKGGDWSRVTSAGRGCWRDQIVDEPLDLVFEVGEVFNVVNLKIL